MLFANSKMVMIEETAPRGSVMVITDVRSVPSQRTNKQQSEVS